MTIVEDDHTEDSFVREAVPHSDFSCATLGA